MSFVLFLLWKTSLTYQGAAGSTEGGGISSSQLLCFQSLWEEEGRAVGHGWQEEGSGAVELLRSLERQTESLTVSKNNQARVRFPESFQVAGLGQGAPRGSWHRGSQTWGWPGFS